MLLAIATIFLMNSCGIDLTELSRQTKVSKNRDTDEEEESDPEDEAKISAKHQLSFEGPLGSQAELSGSISAIGTNGRRSYLYFGSPASLNKVYAFEMASGTISALDTKVKGKSHDKEGLYDAASAKNSVTKNPQDETLITAIVAGPGDAAIISLSGLIHRHGGVYGTAAHGGVLEINKNVVSGVWANLLGSLNSGDGSEISALAVIKDKWIAFSKEKNSIAAYRKFGDKLDEALLGPSGINGDSIGTIVDVSLGAGTDLYVAYDGAVKLRKTADVKELCEIDLGEGAENLTAIAKSSDLQIMQGGSDIVVISALALVGRKLLIGMTNYSQNGGGVAVVDLSDPSFPVTPPTKNQSGVNIKHIAPSENGEMAVISTEAKGIMFFVDNKFIEISDTTLERLKGKKNAAISNVALLQMDRASEAGFKASDAQIGAVNIANMWYVATANKGIFKFRYSQKD